MRLCVQKNKIDIITIGAIIKILSHLAPDKLPINQNEKDCLLIFLYEKTQKNIKNEKLTQEDLDKLKELHHYSLE